ncbi:hypothetical protein, partial [Aquabacterium sp.]|uniref:hypothetical protein n=1 Tax=Aquabacterium sp. TaxID=1872578 RepID=UPI0035B30CBE
TGTKPLGGEVGLSSKELTSRLQTHVPMRFFFKVVLKKMNQLRNISLDGTSAGLKVIGTHFAQ